MLSLVYLAPTATSFDGVQRFGGPTFARSLRTRGFGATGGPKFADGTDCAETLAAFGIAGPRSRLSSIPPGCSGEKCPGFGSS